MTINSNGISTRDTQGRKDQTTIDPSDSVLGKESTVFHETRSQKLAKVNGQQEDHAETKESSLHPTEFPSSSNRVATRSTARPTKRQRKTLTSPQSGVQQGRNQRLSHFVRFKDGVSFGHYIRLFGCDCTLLSIGAVFTIYVAVRSRIMSDTSK